MNTTIKDKSSLGLESFKSLGFKSEKELKKEILKLTRVRKELLEKLN
tara:strand:+ start:910 stop:1050 length:141 start_codon:yes stop_codon:yes gene_type:complete